MSRKKRPRRRSASMLTHQEERMVALLYILMRDHVTLGVMASVIVEHIDQVIDSSGGRRVYSNGHLELYAREIVEGLR